MDTCMDGWIHRLAGSPRQSDFGDLDLKSWETVVRCNPRRKDFSFPLKTSRHPKKYSPKFWSDSTKGKMKLFSWFPTGISFFDVFFRGPRVSRYLWGKWSQNKTGQVASTNDASNFESSKFVFVTDSHAMSAFAKMFSDFTETLRIWL